MKKISRILAGVLLLAVLCIGCGNVAEPEAGVIDTAGIQELEVHYLDVGQGDSILIKNGDHAMLIDAGEDGKGTAVQSYLQKQGVKKLDYVIGTHPDSDHIGGLDVIITKFDCGMILMPEFEKDTAVYRDVKAAVSYKHYKKTVPQAGATYELGDARFTVTGPAGAYGNSSNNWSIGIILQHGEKRFFFTGDAEEEAEGDMAAGSIDLSCDVYKAGHHGSNTSSSEALLDAARPQYAVISCGENNDYGHPRAETLNKFRTRGIKVFRTDEQGTIVAVSDGTDITWNCSPSDTWKAGEPVGGSPDAATASVVASDAVSDAVPGMAPAAGNDSGESGTVYVLNTKSKKFHLPACQSLPSANRKDTDKSRETLTEEGYSPCQRCNP